MSEGFVNKNSQIFKFWDVSFIAISARVENY